MDNNTTTPLQLPELSVILHYRKDSEDREFNLKTLLKFFSEQFELSDISVVNDDSKIDPTIIQLGTKYPNINFLFYENSGVYQRTQCFNILASSVAKGSILAFWDIDVFIDPKFVKQSYNLILESKFDHVYPFNGYFIDIQKDLFELIEERNFDELNKLHRDRHPSLHIASDVSQGGCNLISKEAYNKIGGYDPQFIGWGFEDVDIFRRSSKVNKVKTISDPEAICWHLHHEQAIRLENPYHQHNLQLFNRNNSL